MSIEAMTQALEALESITDYDKLHAARVALRAALSQQPDNTACKSVQKRLEAQQPATAIACGIPGMVKTTCPYCEQGFAFEYEPPVTGGPVGYMNAGQLYELQQGRAPYGYIYPQCGVGADIELFTYPAPGVPDDVQRDAERYRRLRSLEHCNEAWCFIGSGNASSNLDAAIDAAMLTAAQTQKGQP